MRAASWIDAHWIDVHTLSPHGRTAASVEVQILTAFRRREHRKPWYRKLANQPVYRTPANAARMHSSHVSGQHRPQMNNKLVSSVCNTKQCGRDSRLEPHWPRRPRSWKPRGVRRHPGLMDQATTRLSTLTPSHHWPTSPGNECYIHNVLDRRRRGSCGHFGVGVQAPFLNVETPIPLEAEIASDDVSLIFSLRSSPRPSRAQRCGSRTCRFRRSVSVVFLRCAVMRCAEVVRLGT